MDFFSQFIIKHKKSILIVFLIAALLSTLFATMVSVNYNLVDYLPKDAQSTKAIKIMNSEFDSEVPNARIMLIDVSIQEALDYKEKIKAVDGVTSINWIDDLVGLDTLKTTPLEFLDSSILKNYYKDNNALMTLSIESGKETKAINAVYDIIGESNAISGEAVNIAKTQEMSVSEVLNAFAILLPIIIIILIISTTSWLEPLLFLFTIGIAIVINMGTNILFGEVSFITRTVSPILQLAVSLDYAIFLLHSFKEYCSAYKPQDAMKFAMKRSFPTITASAITTIIGFAALIFMRFGIGVDLGLNLLKGIIFSFISVIVFLPSITLMFHKYIEKTRHKKLIPNFRKYDNWLIKIRIPLLILVLIIVIPCYLAQSNTQFIYGAGSIANISRVARDTQNIEENFGTENLLVLLVPNDNLGKENELCNELSNIPHITRIESFVTSVGAEIPSEFVPQEVTKQFYSKNYTRIIMYTDTTEEGSDVFNTIETIFNTTKNYYDKYFLAGHSATLFDMKNLVSLDNKITNLVAIIGIFIVLLITFRSLSLPLFLVFTIETAIWINLSIPYFTGKPISFIGFLILSTVQLGATIDYAILLTNSYLFNRKTLSKMDAIRRTITENLGAILISATILATAGFALAFTTNNPIISDIGTLLGRGTILSFIMVSCVLPALLILFDKVIKRTTFKNNFH